MKHMVMFFVLIACFGPALVESGGSEARVFMARASAVNAAKVALVENALKESRYQFNVNRIEIPDPDYSRSGDALRVHVKGQLWGHVGNESYAKESNRGGAVRLSATLSCQAIVFVNGSGFSGATVSKTEYAKGKSKFCERS